MKKTLLILGVIILFFGYGIYEQFNQKTIKSKRVPCQEETTTFEKVSNKQKIPEAIKLLKSQNIKLNANIEYSKIMDSLLQDNYTLEDLENTVSDVLQDYFTSTKNTDKYLYINYYLYENDKKDTGKKNKDAKKYAGYLVFEFKLDKELLYKIQIDYMNDDASDVRKKIHCVFESFISLAKI